MKGEMKTNWTSKFLISVLVTVFLLVSSSLTVSGSFYDKTSLRSTVISLVPLVNVNLGDKFEIISYQNELKWVKTHNVWEFENDIYIKKWVCENT